MRAPWSLLIILSGCLPTFTSTPAAVAVKDDFGDKDAGEALDARFNVQGGSWRAVDGKLSTLGDHNLPLWLDAPLSKNTRIEFTSTPSSPAVDMKVEVFGDGIRHESGYIVIVGGWNNTLTGIARLDEHEKARQVRRTRFEVGRAYRWRIERTDGKTLALYVDGELQAKYDDANPLWGARNNRFAFSGWESEVTFDDLTITPLPD